ncbi:MAG TPA: carboxypeptidase-like regulatory domain-containing protein [Blastocatellia bacterium]|nr:carboxypeptidase-like regulatory domain-containing protein [Blastocatellia bacterium]
MSTRRRRLIVNPPGWILAMILTLGFSITSFAQSDNTQISGFVKDQAGGVVANAKVTIKSETRNFERTANTNSEGYYVITQLPPGLYTIAVEANGFKLYRETNKKLDPNLPASLDVQLDPGQLTDVVNVTATTTTVQTETATVGKLIEGKQIQYLQLNGRNPLFLSILKPGVNSNNALGSFNFGLTTGGMNINGGRTQDMLITYDGAVGVRTRSNGTSIGVADIESTQEVQILTANYNAEYGRASGGQVRIVTKSGTQDFHGTFFDFMRNSAFNANTWTRNKSPNPDPTCENNPKIDACRPSPFRFNQFGYSLSGPVIIPGTRFNKDRNKLFWLWGQEWVKQRSTDNIAIRVPTLKMRQGDFSEVNANVSNPFYNPRLGYTAYLRDPQKSGICDATNTAACFSDNGVLNKIPLNDPRLSPNGLALLRAYPEPIPGFLDSSGHNFFQSRPTRTDQRKDTLSIDFYPSEKHQLKYRMSLYHFVDVSAFRSNTDRAPQIIDRPNQTASIGWTWTVSPNWISEVLVAGSRDQVFISVDTSGNRYQRSNYGINYNYIFPTNKEIFDKIPTVDGLGITDMPALDGGPYPSQSTGPIYQLTNNWTNVRGSHTLKFGGYFERSGQNDFDQINVSGIPGGTNNQNGRFVFSNSTANGTGSAIGNMAIGLFDTYAEIGARSYTPYRGNMYEWFVQDSWKATPKLRLEYGVRHTIIQPYYSLWGNMVVFDQDSYNPANAATIDPVTGNITSDPRNLRSLYNGLVIPGNGWPDAAKGRVGIASTGEFDFMFRGADKEYSKIHYGNFQPRLGIAYGLSDKMAIRAGVGRFLTRLGVSDSVFLGGNPPLQPTVSVSGGDVDNPGGNSSTGFTAFPLPITSQDRDFKVPESWTWNFSLEREIGFNTTLEVGYVGRRGLHAQRERNINQLAVGTKQANPLVNENALRPYKGFGVIRVTNNDANSMYHGLQIGANRRFTKGLLFGAAYTYSKSSDDGSAQRDVIANAFDASTLWGPSTFDRRHVLVLNAVYELPFFKDRSRLSGKLLGGWAVSAISQFQSGVPFSLTFGGDQAGVGSGSGRQFYLLNGDVQTDHKFSSSGTDTNRWFFVNATLPAAGTISTQKTRNLIYGPGFQNHNLGLFKDFAITEKHRLQFRAEAFNWLNHPNLGGATGSGVYDFNAGTASGIDLVPGTNTFGKLTAKGGERTLQFALRYSF